MRTETEITFDGMQVLVDKLGMVEAEKFIAIIHTESFDYTQWRERLWTNKTVEELSHEAMSYRKNQNTK
jgi:hypothetical protein